MRNYIILNETNSSTVNGLLIQELPPISKPRQRAEVEEIDGRDGDIITKLGYSAYDKKISIGLYGNYNVDNIISYFMNNQNGKVIFSNEPDKYYNYEILEQIDFERLIRYKTASVTLHCQPFKYSTTESKIQINATEVSGSGSNITLNNTENGALFTNFKINGDTSQTGTPTPSDPIDVDIVTGDNTITISNEDNTESQTYTISLGTKELCKIGNYQDYIYYNNGWYIHKEIGEVVLNGSENWSVSSTNTSGIYRFRTSEINNLILKPASSSTLASVICSHFETKTANQTYQKNQGISVDASGDLIIYHSNITSNISNFATWLSSNNVTIYYVLETSTDIEITDSDLINQLEALINATTYLNQTNIVTSGDDLSPLLDVTTYSIDNPSFNIINNGNIYSKPIITIYGVGVVGLYLNGVQILSLNMGETTSQITIDVNKLEAYNKITGSLMNRQVTGDYNKFTLNVGNNTITESGTLQGLEIENYSRWI